MNQYKHSRVSLENIIMGGQPRNWSCSRLSWEDSLAIGAAAKYQGDWAKAYFSTSHQHILANPQKKLQTISSLTRCILRDPPNDFCQSTYMSKLHNLNSQAWQLHPMGRIRAQVLQEVSWHESERIPSL